MVLNIKKTLTVFSVMSCFATASLFGEVSNAKTNTPYAVPPAKNPSSEDSMNFYIGASYTYWAPYQENTAVASSVGSATIVGGVIVPAFTAQSGFKVCLGANTTHDGWMVGLNYAWFNNQPSLKTATVVTTPYTSFFPSAADELYVAFETQFQNQFNRIDAQLDRQFYAGHYFAFRPWLGLLAAWDQQYIHIHQTTTLDDIEVVSEHQNWWGIGPYAGGEGSFYFTDDFSGYISSGLAMLLSNHKVTSGALNVDANHVTTGVLSNMYVEYNNMEPMLEASLGVRWNGTWPNWGLCIDLAWETQTYFSHANINEVAAGSYSMQGLTLGAKVSF